MEGIVEIEEDCIRQVTAAVWEVLVGGVIEPSTGARWSGVPAFVSGRVHVTGPWSGAIAVHCSPDVARHVAEVMFARGSTETEDVKDALGEVANVVGGNLKPLLPGPSRLSMPVALVPGGPLEEVRQGGVEQSVWFECEGQPVVVELVHDGREGERR